MADNVSTKTIDEELADKITNDIKPAINAILERVKSSKDKRATALEMKELLKQGLQANLKGNTASDTSATIPDKIDDLLDPTIDTTGLWNLLARMNDREQIQSDLELLLLSIATSANEKNPEYVDISRLRFLRRAHCHDWPLYYSYLLCYFGRLMQELRYQLHDPQSSATIIALQEKSQNGAQESCDNADYVLRGISRCMAPEDVDSTMAALENLENEAKMITSLCAAFGTMGAIFLALAFPEKVKYIYQDHEKSLPDMEWACAKLFPSVKPFLEILDATEGQPRVKSSESDQGWSGENAKGELMLFSDPDVEDPFAGTWGMDLPQMFREFFPLIFKD